MRQMRMDAAHTSAFSATAPGVVHKANKANKANKAYQAYQAHKTWQRVAGAFAYCVRDAIACFLFDWKKDHARYV